MRLYVIVLVGANVCVPVPEPFCVIKYFSGRITSLRTHLLLHEKALLLEEVLELRRTELLLDQLLHVL